MGIQKHIINTFKVDVAAGNSLKSTLASSQNEYLTNVVPQDMVRHVTITVEVVEEDAT